MPHLAATRGAARIGLPEAMAGAGDEHVFERRLAERDRFDLAGKSFDQPRDPAVAVRHVPIALRHPATCASHRNCSRIAAASRAGSAVRIVIESPPTVARKASGVSSATSWPSWRMAMRSALSASSSKCVVSTTVTPCSSRSVLQVIPQVAARAGIESRAGLVQQQQPRAMDAFPWPARRGGAIRPRGSRRDRGHGRSGPVARAFRPRSLRSSEPESP